MMLYGGLSGWRPMSDRGKPVGYLWDVVRLQRQVILSRFGYGAVLEIVFCKNRQVKTRVLEM